MDKDKAGAGKPAGEVKTAQPDGGKAAESREDEDDDQDQDDGIHGGSRSDIADATCCRACHGAVRRCIA